jgi:serine/threonine protein kinase/Tol biopolymer transport system component
MPKTDGRFLHYELISLLGAGGMGEVYLATDSQLGRKVAVKFLPDDCVHDNALDRFILEAKAASALNHPNIITIYEIGEHNGDHYIATEFIHGKTLREKLIEKKLDLNSILKITLQVCEALAAAHEVGIAHRDIKPENIMIRGDGYVKILDFGLAKLTHRAANSIMDFDADTKTMAGTMPGVVVGTVRYMSPEQARGRHTDTRTDVWSTGVVLFEMLTGHLPFDGETPSDVIADILRRPTPSLAAYAPKLPAELNRIVEKALRKDREERYQHVKDMLLDLKDVARSLDTLAGNGVPQGSETRSFFSRASSDHNNGDAVTADPAFPHQTRSISEIIQIQFRTHPWLAALCALFCVAILAGAAAWVYRANRDRDAFQAMRLTKLTASGNASSGNIALSSDGKYTAYVLKNDGREGIWVRQVGNDAAIEIVSAGEGSIDGLTFAKGDASVIYSIADRSGAQEIREVPVLGGPGRTLVHDGEGPVSFSPDGKQFAFVRGRRSLMIASADGSQLSKLADCTRCQVWKLPAWSPAGDLIVLANFVQGETLSHLVAVSVADGSERTLWREGWLAVNGIAWLPDGSGLIFISRDVETQLSQLWKVGFPDGDLRKITNDLSSYQGLSLSADGTQAASVQEIVASDIWVAPEGDLASRRKITNENDKGYGLSGIAWSPDGRILFTERRTGTQDILIMDLDGSNRRQLTFNARSNLHPAVSPDGRTIVFVSDRGGSTDLWRMNIDGTDARPLTQDTEVESLPDVTPDGKWVVYQRTNSSGTPSIWKIGMTGEIPTQLVEKQSARPRVSPDGKFVACQYWDDGPSGPLTTAIVPFERGLPVAKLAFRSNYYRWSRDGRSLIYVDAAGTTPVLKIQPVSGGDPGNIGDLGMFGIYRFDISRAGYGMAAALGNETSDVVLLRGIN